MVTHGFKRRSYDCCVYFKQYKTCKHIYLLLYVDDMLIACEERTEIENLKGMLKSTFDMKDLRLARKFKCSHMQLT